MKIEAKRSLLYNIFKPVRPVADEMKVEIDEDGLSFVQVDSAHVCMVSMEISNSAFESWEVETERELGLNIKQMLKFLQYGSPSELVEIELLEDESKIKITLTEENMYRQLPLLDTAGMTEPNIPDLDLPYSFDISQADLRKAVRAVTDISEHMKIELTEQVEGKVVNLKTEEDEHSTGKTIEGYEGDGTMTAMYATEYLSDITKKLPKVDIHADIGPDYPVHFNWKFEDDNGSALFMIAPRIESQ